MSKRVASANNPGTAKRSKKEEEDDEDEIEREEEEEDREFITVKMTLRQIIKPEHRERIMRLITDYSLNATRIYYLASTYVLHQVNNAYDNRNFAFFNQNFAKFIENAFYGVLQKYRESEFMSPDFSGMSNTQWPNNDGFGNAFIYLYELYHTCFVNTIRAHRKNNIKKFLRIKAFEHNTQVTIERKITGLHIEYALDWVLKRKEHELDEIAQFNFDLLLTLQSKNKI